jgi:hypothetical protein
MGFGSVSNAANALYRNPFYLLGATTRDNQSRIVALTDERSLTLDPDLCQKARAELAGPRSRLSAELSWFPGVSPRRAQAAVESLGDESTTLNVTELPPLARANVLAARIESGRSGGSDVVTTLFAIAAASEEIDPGAVMRDVNEDRSIAGIPPVIDLDSVHAEIAARRRYYRDVSRTLLDGLPVKSLVDQVTELAVRATDRGRRRAPILVEDIVDAYETSAQAFAERENKNLEKLIEQIRATAPEGEERVLPIVDALCGVLTKWSYVFKPVQIVSYAKGIDHPASQTAAYRARSLSVDLYNEHTFADAAARLTECLKREFAYLLEFAERVSEDSTTLTEFLKTREQAKSNKAEFERSLSYSAEIGALLKSRVEMSAAGLTWKGQTFRLEDINRFRWGGTRHSVNGIPTGTTYEIHVGTPNKSAVINLRNQTIYDALVERLWRGVGVRLIFEYVAHLKGGGQLNFPGAVIEDGAVTLTRHRTFRANEEVRVTWDKTRIWNAPGCFVIGVDGEKNVYAMLSYTGMDNVIVLENLIRFFFKSGKPRVSATFE